MTRPAEVITAKAAKKYSMRAKASTGTMIAPMPRMIAAIPKPIPAFPFGIVHPVTIFKPLIHWWTITLYIGCENRPGFRYGVSSAREGPGITVLLSS